MKEFSCIYSKSEEKRALFNLKKAVLVYSLAAAIFVALCALFLTLYIVCGVNLYLCFGLNFLFTVVFIWLSIVFFSAVLPVVKSELRFYRVEDNAIKTAFRGKYLRYGDEVRDGSLIFRELYFCAPDGEKCLLLKKDKEIPFENGADYDLLLVGKRVVYFKECEE